ncbi:26336_t:CDS:2 [Gigaspora rosea]|nr:26336_t:CDS:2 [Gigaspora rosea]
MALIVLSDLQKFLSIGLGQIEMSTEVTIRNFTSKNFNLVAMDPSPKSKSVPNVVSAQEICVPAYSHKSKTTLMSLKGYLCYKINEEGSYMVISWKLFRKEPKHHFSKEFYKRFNKECSRVETVNGNGFEIRANMTRGNKASITVDLLKKENVKADYIEN